VSLVPQLLNAGLLDELHLFVHPATAGSGLRLFEDGGPERHLRLIAAQAFKTGVVYLVYGPDPNPPAGSYEQAQENLPQE
jgi:dihydrofolate reductase